MNVIMGGNSILDYSITAHIYFVRGIEYERYEK